MSYSSARTSVFYGNGTTDPFPRTLLLKAAVLLPKKTGLLFASVCFVQRSAVDETPKLQNSSAPLVEPVVHSTSFHVSDVVLGCVVDYWQRCLVNLRVCSGDICLLQSI